MINKDIVFPSSQIDSVLPNWIANPDSVVSGIERSLIRNNILTRESYPNENYRNFVNFMTRAAESEERIGFGQDILQSLLDYRDFLSYKQQIVEYTTLATSGNQGTTIINNILDDLDESDPIPDGSQVLLDFSDEVIGLPASEEDEIHLMSGVGFPLKNGVILITNGDESQDEIILYRQREGDVLRGLLRGASATIILPTFRRPGSYIKTEPKNHEDGSKVVNVSTLFLSSILDTIHRTFTYSIDSENVAIEINRATFLSKVKHFFRSKGSKLGIKALFKILFAENDVEVNYPGDRMMIPSNSTWFEPYIMRTVPVPEVFCNPRENYILPDKLIGSTLVQRPYSGTVTDVIIDDMSIQDRVLSSEDLIAKTVVEYAVSYQNEAETQYELYVNKDDIKGDFVINPTTKLTNNVNKPDRTDADDFSPGVDVIVVESTLGFPDQGIIFIDDEAIYYRGITQNEFLNCIRGYIGVDAVHSIGTTVYGPYYVEGRAIDEDGVEHVSRSWPVGLVRGVNVENPGSLHEKEDDVIVNGPGSCPINDPLFCILNEDTVERTFINNDNYVLIDQLKFGPTMAYVEDRTTGLNGIYFNEDFGYFSTSGTPYYKIGDFVKENTGAEISDLIGLDIEIRNQIHIIPKRTNIKENIITEEIIDDIPVREYTFSDKGTDVIGLATDGVRYFSNNSEVIISQGRIVNYNILDKGFGYLNPTLVIQDDFSGTEKTDQGDITVDPLEGLILNVTPTSDYNYNSVPPVRISSGEGAVLKPTLDRYGRIISVSIDEPGKYYNDQPTIKALDPSGVGKGALISVEVSQGEVVGVTIVNPGIDYQTGTVLQVIPVGGGAEVEAVVEFYRFNRYNEVIFSDHWQYDMGNGFLYPDPFTVSPKRTQYGYVCNPNELRDTLEDDGSEHSPILGFAFDGNPIYGPYGYVNNTDDTAGIERQESAYRLIPNRTVIIPGGGGTQSGINPPSPSVYPLGSFIQDYIYDPYGLYPPPGLDGKYVIRTEEESENVIKTDDTDELLEIDSFVGTTPPLPNRLLDENNGKICNTPEYPKELYPDGVYCYFISVESDDVTPAFPYVIGKTFNNRPTSQVIDITSKETINLLPRENLIYSSSLLQESEIIKFDYQTTTRFRVPYLYPNKNDIKLEISDTSSGSVSDVVVQNSISSESRVGDSLFFDNDGSGGTGAEAKVSFVFGVNVDSAEGSIIKDKIVSHRQIVNLFSNVDSDGDVLTVGFTVGILIEFRDSNNNSIIARVIDWDSDTRDLTLGVLTEDLIEVGHTFYDAGTTLLTVKDVVTVDEPKDSDILWLNEESIFLPGDKMLVENGEFRDLDGNGESEYYEDEELLVTELNLNTSYNVSRGYFTGDPLFDIPNDTEVYNLSRYLYTVKTTTPHSLNIGDPVYINNSEFDEVNGLHQVIKVSDDKKEFSIFTRQLYGVESNTITFESSSESITGEISKIRLTSGGVGYKRLPTVPGVANMVIDRAFLDLTNEDGVITDVNVLMPGRRYTNPIVHVFDRTNNGSGAEITVQETYGIITSATLVSGGSGYIEPECIVLDDIGKFLPITENIGRLKGFDVLSPGKGLGGDSTLLPEILIDTRVIVKYTSNSLREFAVGETLYTGILENKTASGVVKDYDSDLQMITFEYYKEPTTTYENKILGNFEVGKLVYNDTGTIGEVVCNGQAKTKIDDDVFAKPKGKFLDDTSKLANGEANPYSVIQDSYRYQWFSYVISSPLQEVNYNTFIDKIIHPSGFNRFSEVRINSSVASPSSVSNLTVSVETIFIDPCDPLPLITSQDSIPIITTDFDGNERVLLVNEELCSNGSKPDPIRLNVGNMIVLSGVTPQSVMGLNGYGMFAVFDPKPLS